jgi:hypothetical protein
MCAYRFKHRNVKAMEVWFHAFLTLALDKDEWSASSFSRFKPLKMTASVV